ncbi:hypothetical protein [Kitasatospora sp. NPDC004531]
MLVTRVSKLVAFSVAAIAAAVISAASVEYSGNVAGDVTWGGAPGNPVLTASGSLHTVLGPNDDVTWGRTPGLPGLAAVTENGPNGDVTWGG